MNASAQAANAATVCRMEQSVNALTQRLNAAVEACWSVPATGPGVRGLERFAAVDEAAAELLRAGLSLDDTDTCVGVSLAAIEQLLSGQEALLMRNMFNADFVGADMSCTLEVISLAPVRTDEEYVWSMLTPRTKAGSRWEAHESKLGYAIAQRGTWEALDRLADSQRMYSRMSVREEHAIRNRLAESTRAVVSMATMLLPTWKGGVADLLDASDDLTRKPTQGAREKRAINAMTRNSGRAQGAGRTQG